MSFQNPHSTFLSKVWNIFSGSLDNIEDRESQDNTDRDSNGNETTKSVTNGALISQSVNNREDEETSGCNDRKTEISEKENDGALSSSIVDERLDSLLFQLCEKSRDYETLKKDYSNLIKINSLLKEQLDEANVKIKLHHHLVENYEALKREFDRFKQAADSNNDQTLEDFRETNRRTIARHIVDRESDRWIFRKEFQNLELTYENKLRSELAECERLVQGYELKQDDLTTRNELLRKKIEDSERTWETAVAERREAYQLLNEKEIELSQLERRLRYRDDTSEAKVTEVKEACQLELTILRRQQKEKHEALLAELFCPICTEVFRDAVTLDCSHTFCDQCICTWGNTSESGGICPVCRKKIAYKVKTLVINTFADKICEMSK